VFDGGFSADGLGRPLAKFEWAQVGSTNARLAAAITNANAGSGSMRLVIPGSALTSIPNGDYTLRLNVTNFLGTSAAAEATFAKQASGTAPVVSVLGGLTQAFTVADGIKVSTALLASSVCANKKVCVCGGGGCGVV
jgi:hypothetical protein